uniref:C-type lectin domain-containing protein n=1 Tax=Chelonoidis abingdonii TaxID=106734 RepID=A0A8C0J2C0_CHEAB
CIFRSCPWLGGRCFKCPILDATLTPHVTFSFSVLAPKLSSADQCPSAGPKCPDGWIGYRGKCYFFSETEGNWTYSQSHCSAPDASLAGIDSEQEMMFLLLHKDIHDHWIGLRREQGQPWKWTNGIVFNHPGLFGIPPSIQSGTGPLADNYSVCDPCH